MAGQVIGTDELFPCYYCGLPADTLDHVVPRAVLEQVRLAEDAALTVAMVKRHHVLIVDACRECNSLLGDDYFPTLAERRAALKERLRRRYRRILATGTWTEHELGELSDRLQLFVLGRVELKKLIGARLAWGEPVSAKRAVA